MQFHELVARHVDTFAHGGHEVPGHQRNRWCVLGVVLTVPDAAPHVQQISESARGDETGLRTLPGQHGVGRNRRAVHNRGDPAEKFLERFTDGVRGLGQPSEQALGRVVRCGGRLVDSPGTVPFHHEEIGERPSDIDSDPATGCSACIHHRDISVQ